MYELARKHCGQQGEWKISLALLQKKCGSVSTEKEFRRLVLNIIEEDREFRHMPDYSVRMEETDMIVFRNRGTMTPPQPPSIPSSVDLSEKAIEEGRKTAPGWDIYQLEREWREWITEPPRDYEAAFVGFCRKVYERRGAPK